MASKKKILVTGGVGFIGSHTIVALIEAGYDPIIIDNLSNSKISVLKSIEKITSKSVKFYENDCNDITALRNIFRIEKNIVGVIHFAANKAVGESVIDPLKYYHNNIGTLVALLTVLQEYNVSNLVFSSSCTVYGQPDVLPVTEKSSVLKAQSPYGNTKQICEEIITDVYNSGKEIKAISLRYFNPIGAHASGLIGELPLGIPGNLIPFVTQTAAGIREELTVFGNDYNTPDGTCVRDYIHVADIANAHIRALFDDMPTGVYNLGSSAGTSNYEIIRTAEEITGRKLKLNIDTPRAGDPAVLTASSDRFDSVAERWRQHDLRSMIKDAWAWYNQ